MRMARMPFGSSARPVSSSRPLFLFISRAGFWVNQNGASLWRPGQTPPSEFRPCAPSHCQRRRRSVGTEAGAIPTAHGRGQMAHHPPRKRRPRAPRRVSGRSPAQYIAVRCVIAPLATASTGRGVGQGGRAMPRATAGRSWPRIVGTWARASGNHGRAHLQCNRIAGAADVEGNLNRAARAHATQRLPAG